MRVVDRDLIRGGHYGQRSCEPHSKAEHMAAPTNAALVRKALPTRSRPHMAISCRADQLLSRQLSGVKQTRLTFRRAAANDPWLPRQPLIGVAVHDPKLTSQEVRPAR